MELTQATQFLQSAIPNTKGVWADIGAGSGTFTLALDQLLPNNSTIYALDKNIQSLRHISLKNCHLKVQEQDFNDSFDLPLLDGILMANTLHYSPDPIKTLSGILPFLKPNGLFIFIEYELDQPRKPWIPYPITFQQFKTIANKVALSIPEEMGRLPSAFGNNYIYLAKCNKLDVL